MAAAAMLNLLSLSIFVK